MHAMYISFLRFVSLLLVILQAPLIHADATKPLLKKMTLRTSDACAIDVTFDGRRFQAKQVEDAYRFLVSYPLEFDKDWDLTDLKQADFPTTLKTEKERLLKIAKILLEVKHEAIIPPGNVPASVLGYKLEPKCLQYLKDKTEWSGCQSEVNRLFPIDERERAFEKIILKQSDDYGCEP